LLRRRQQEPRAKKSNKLTQKCKLQLTYAQKERTYNVRSTFLCATLYKEKVRLDVDAMTLQLLALTT